MLLRELLVHLFPHTFLCVFAPLDARNNVVVNDKTAFLAGDLKIVREYLDLLATLGTFFEGKSRSPLIRGTRAPVKHGYPPLSYIPSGGLLHIVLFSLTGRN